MCSIAGIFAYKEDSPPVEREELLRCREAMVTRDPDGAGIWVSPGSRVGLAHRRLSIIDLSDSGSQPTVAKPRCRCISGWTQASTNNNTERELMGEACMVYDLRRSNL